MLHKSQDNPYVGELYSSVLGEVGGHKAHELLHTGYKNRKRIVDEQRPAKRARCGQREAST